jgi:hypothetical protein
VHHFGFAGVCWAIWKCRNKAVFVKKIIRSPAEIILHACTFMIYWTGLFEPKAQEAIMEGSTEET